MNLYLAMLSAYLLGSVPFGYLIPRIWHLDIRRHGSGNIGATNVFRTLGPFAGCLVFLLDLGKGALPVFLAQYWYHNPWSVVLVGAAAVLGHTYPLFLKFKGGRGAATGLGILLGFAPDIFLGALAAAGLLIWLTRYVSVASLVTTLLVTLAFALLKRPLPYTLVAASVSVIIIIRHLPNIQRLREGRETKIGQAKRDE